MLMCRRNYFFTLTSRKAQVSYRSIAYHNKEDASWEGILEPGSFPLNLTCSFYGSGLQFENKAGVQFRIIFIHEVLV